MPSTRPAAFLLTVLLLSACGILSEPKKGPDPDVYVAYVAETRLIPWKVDETTVYVVMKGRPMDPDSIIDNLRPFCDQIPKSSTHVEVFNSERQYRVRSHDVKGPLSARLNAETGALVWNLDGPDQSSVYNAGPQWCGNGAKT